ncbi:MAG: glycosyltransferase family 2 protein [Verrucomicrobiales bacterium]
MAASRPTILIPSFNTGPLLAETVEAALSSRFPVKVVIDGSTDGSDAELQRFEEHPRFTIHRLPNNQGKGAAVLHGLRHARADGCTHALTMDADGQHPAASIPNFFDWSQRFPEAAIFGKPIFDDSAPALRVNGRKVSNFWANLETLGWGIGDSLFGMRLYPINELITTLEETSFARRFDFDPEVAVRLAWKGVPIVNLPTPVRYIDAEDGGVSQFRYFRDNTLLTWMHLRLMWGFALRVPWLAFRGENPLLHLSPPA